MKKLRLDQFITNHGLVPTRSQAENYIKLGKVKVNGTIVKKPSVLVSPEDKVQLTGEQYVSRAALKLSSIAEQFGLDFRNKTVLDVGSSTGGFTDYALQHGAGKVIAVDVGTNQLHPSLLGHPKIELHEKTDIREFVPSQKVNIVMMDVSFISVRYLLPHIAIFTSVDGQIVVMLKPQFEAGREQVNKGIIKNDKIRRQILKDFEHWVQKNGFVIANKADSQVAGTKGNIERFYLLSITRR